MARPFNLLRQSVAHVYGVCVDEMSLRRQARFLVHASQMLAYAARKLLGWSYARIARIMNRDHSTITYSYRKVEDRIKSDQTTQNQMVAIMKDYIRRTLLPDWPSLEIEPDAVSSSAGKGGVCPTCEKPNTY